ncbi:MAG TPA: NAD(P)(+) transhydrogenase (Re/Si-specific) subunit beta [Actinomycetes bacterium]|nr:NAD(P)(+) transhydrogenase (Re/Si-specific) subunit beta [Actinomycetes bacterium]
MNQTWVQLAYLVAALCFILALKGLSSPKFARRGNIIGAIGAMLAVVVTLFAEDYDHMPAILAAVAVGTAFGVPAARRVQMTAMPQLVALFNGVGGGAAAIVALIEVLAGVEHLSVGALAASTFTILIGSVSFSGSVITFLKLQGAMTSRPVVFVGMQILLPVTAVAAVGLAVAVLSTESIALAYCLAAVSLLLGVLFVLPVGGADVPIVISLLNAATGVAVAASGFVLENVLLLVAGTLVGASGTLLTLLMAKAMGRPLGSTLFGALLGGSTLGGGEASDRPVKSVGPTDVAVMLGYAQRVVIVPGYGLAVAQAQGALKELVDLLGERGVEVSYGIHPVAGRMPGHMNVLLAEANVPYEQLKEMDEINPELPTTDVALVVGANDVVNPAARTPGTPISGMPIINVDQAQSVVFLKRSMRPGFAGIENELLYDPKTQLLFGDAKDSLGQTVTALKSL